MGFRYFSILLGLRVALLTAVLALLVWLVLVSLRGVVKLTVFLSAA